MAWAAQMDVASRTGTTAAAEINRAQSVIDVFSGVTEADRPNLSTRDIGLLTSAVCYQAAWQEKQVDVFSRTDVTSVEQDGVKFTAANEDSLVLAPLAKRCLDRLSWRKPRSVQVVPTDRFGRPRFGPAAISENAFLRDGAFAGASDGDWRPA